MDQPPADMRTQNEKAVDFQRLHERAGAFVIPNPWDAGSARLLTSSGFEALTTTSAGLSFSLGRRDGSRLVSRQETLENAKAIVAATHLPVAADLEGGFGDRPEDAAQTIREAAQVAGLVGGSIEDSTGDPAHPIYDFSQAVERVHAAAEAARSLGFPFMFVGRAENFLHGRRDLDDTVRRLQAYEAAGADVLYAPGLSQLEEVRTVCQSITRPVNVLVGVKSPDGGVASVEQLASVGARRISLGGALTRAALGALMRAVDEIRDKGTFTFLNDAAPFAEISARMLTAASGT